MKILHLISGGDTGGARTHVHLLLKHLNQGNEAALVCFMDGPFAEEARALGIPTMVLGGSIPGALKRLRAMLREDGYQIVHCHGSRGNLIGALLKPACKGVPLISTVHSDPRLDYKGRPLANLTYGTLNALALRRMDYYVGVSDSMRELLISRGFDANRIFAIYNGVEFDDAPPAPPGERAAFYREVGLDADENSVVVGIGARFDAVKDVSTLLRGFARAYKDHPRLRLLIAGDGKERGMLEALARELGIDGVTCFAGWQTDMRRFYRCIDINTLTSLSETFPYAITEGARERLCAVSTRVGGVPKLIRPGETGFLINPGDAEALGEKLSTLAEDAALRKRMGDKLYEKARAEFSAAATAGLQLNIYERALADRARRARRERAGAVICGAYGMRNAGDEAVLDAILAEMRAIDPEIPLTVLSRSPKETRAVHHVTAIHSFRLLAFLREAKRSKLYINGGGSLIQDVTSSRSLWYYLMTLLLAKKGGCAVMMYGCGVGPVTHSFNRRQAGRIIDRCVDAITLREAHSLSALKELGVTRPLTVVAAEPALSLSGAGDEETGALLSRFGMEPDGAYFCICVRRWPGVEQKAEIFARAAEYAWKKHGLTPVILSVNVKQDAQSAAQVRALVSGETPCHTVTEGMTVEQVIGFLSRMRAVMAMRLHPLIFSASQAVPLIGVSYDPKVASFLADVAPAACIDFSALLRPEQLYPLIDAAAGADREALRAATERLRAAERRNTDTARRFLI